MKNKLLLITVKVIILLILPFINFCQAPNLGTAASFVLFSGVGAVGNTGISHLTGNIGTNSGAISGFGNVNGVMHNSDAATAQAVIDLGATWHYLDTLHPTLAHGPILGGGEILYAGVDTIAAAGSVVGLLTLDAQGDSNAVFIIKIGGALTTAASATVNLVNGAMACNVFWITKGGAISLASLTTMRGNLIANPGAIDMGDGCTFEGRAFSTTGAVTVYGTLAYIPIGCGSPLLTGPLPPALNTVKCFALFSSDGTVSNTGITNITGDIGTNNGVTAGYNPMLVAGIVHPGPDAFTLQCKSDLLNVYNYLNTLPYDIELLYPAQFGNKLTLTPHTYRMNAAAVFTDTLYLDAEGNSNAIFVIQVNGALTTAAYSTVRLVNGTQSKNIYWVVQGAVSIASNAIFIGNIICNNGAIILNTGVTLDGRALTRAGDINTIATVANNAFGGYCSVLPIQLLSFTGACDMQNVMLNWSTGIAANNNYFTIERSADGFNWQEIGRINDAENSSSLRNYSFTDNKPGQSILYYRLKQTDISGNSKYGNIIDVEKCSGQEIDKLAVYPNPSNGKFVISFTGDKSKVHSMEIFNAIGEKVYGSMGFQSKIDLSNKTQGVYFVNVQLETKIITTKILVKK